MRPENLDDCDGIPDEDTDFLRPGHPELFDDDDAMIWDIVVGDGIGDDDTADHCPECGYRYLDGECMCDDLIDGGTDADNF